MLQELDTSRQLILAGLGDLQELDMGNDFYHLPHQSLAGGLERLMKCYICLVHQARNGSYPTSQMIRDLGHDLSAIQDAILRDYYNVNGRSLLNTELAFVRDDRLLQQIIHILSDFGKFARYYNLDVVTGKQNISIDPSEEWGSLERDIEDPTPYLADGSQDALYRDYYPRVHSKIIAKIERFTRAIALQFTLGGHGGKLRQFSTCFDCFRNLRDEQLGTTDYRRSVKVLRREHRNWTMRTPEQLADSPWPKQTVSRAEFSDTWPFRAAEVTIECRDKIVLVVNIHGFDFALNGVAAGHLNLPFPHDAGEALIGKSVGPFIDMARRLGEND